jgi:hypothetical protein
MDQHQDDTTEEIALLKAFRDGMIKRHYGIYIDSEGITLQGLDEASAATKGLRARRPHGIRALEPLLDDPDPGVRAGAGEKLMFEMPEKAQPVFQALGNSAELEAGMVARVALYFYEKDKHLYGKDKSIN